MTDMLSAPAIVCPAFCSSTHDERPGVTVSHETSPVEVEQIPGEGSPVDLRVAHYEGDAAPLLHVGSYTFDPAGAEQMLSSLSALVTVMRGAR